MKNALVVVSLVFAASAFAGPTKPTTPSNTKEVSWTELKDSCQNPGNFQNQNAPSAIKIACTDTLTTWMPADAGLVNLEEGRSISASIISNKYNVAKSSAAVAALGKTGACPRFKEIQQTISFERSVSCGDILNYKGDQNDFCVEVIDAVKAKNPGLVTSVETGRVIGTCDKDSGSSRN